MQNIRNAIRPDFTILCRHGGNGQTTSGPWRLRMGMMAGQIVTIGIAESAILVYFIWKFCTLPYKPVETFVLFSNLSMSPLSMTRAAIARPKAQEMTPSGELASFHHNCFGDRRK